MKNIVLTRIDDRLIHGQVVRLLFFERCKRMTDKQLSHLQGVFVWLFDFLLKKILKRKPHVPE